jgi:radical SAM superfamily enzyme YgiQ (UPF0313 family)
MKVLLIDPTFYHEGGLYKTRRIGYFPLTLARLAACFPRDVDVALIYEKTREVPVTAAVDLVFFSVMGANLRRAIELSAEFRRCGVKTVIGGMSILGFSDLCREHFDVVAVGDAEGIIPELLEDFRRGGLKPDYESLCCPIASLPRPRFDLVPPEIVGSTIPIETSRGCCNGCRYCAITAFYRGGFRTRNSDEVLAEVDDLKNRFGMFKLFYFTDPNFTADMAHAKTVLRGLIGRKIAWLASADIKCLQDEEFLRLAAQSGCVNLQIGIETLFGKELAGANKTFASEADYAACLTRANLFGIPITALLMIGWDSDTPAALAELQRFLRAHHVALAVTHPIQPIPGTPLFHKWEAESRLLPVSLDALNGLEILFRPAHFTPEGLKKAYWRFNERFFATRSIVRRFFSPHILRNPLGYGLMLATNFFARDIVEKRLPAGMYE